MYPVFVYIVVVIVACLLFLCCIRGLGFGAAGVVAGSIASLIQAIIGNVASGSMFAISQSIGATGNLPCLIIIVVAIIVAYIMYQFGWWFW